MRLIRELGLYARFYGTCLLYPQAFGVHGHSGGHAHGHGHDRPVFVLEDHVSTGLGIAACKNINLIIISHILTSIIPKQVASLWNILNIHFKTITYLKNNTTMLTVMISSFWYHLANCL